MNTRGFLHLGHLGPAIFFMFYSSWRSLKMGFLILSLPIPYTFFIRLLKELSKGNITSQKWQCKKLQSISSLTLRQREKSFLQKGQVGTFMIGCMFLLNPMRFYVNSHSSHAPCIEVFGGAIFGPFPR